MHITDMQPGDLESVQRLAAQLGYPESLADIRARYVDVAQNPNHKLWVVKRDDQVVAWMHVCASQPSLIVEKVMEVPALVVDEACRGQGIGAALLRKAESWAKENGLRLMKLYSNVSREDAHRFYEGQGFTSTKTSRLFTKDIVR
jgi:GNAT superfamily N-acetyltransferase